MSTIGTVVNHGVTLGTVTQNGTYASPLTITAAGYVDNAGSGAAVFGPNAAAWYVDNLGTVTAADGSGISLKAGGTVINSGHIIGAGVNTQIGPFFAGVYIGGAAGMLVNTGTIAGPNGVDLYAGGTVTNAGLITNPGSNAALGMAQPGYVSIASTGTVSGGIGVFIGDAFQAIGPSTLINSGVIIGSQYLANPGRYFGAYIGSGGTLVNNAGGTISGMVFANRGPLTVIDYGTITSPKGPAIYLYDGGTVTIGNFTTSSLGIAGPATATPEPEVPLVVGDMQFRQPAGVNIGVNAWAWGALNFAGPGSVNNQGLISVSAGSAIVLEQGGTVINGGGIVGGGSVAAILFTQPHLSGNFFFRIIINHNAFVTGGIGVSVGPVAPQQKNQSPTYSAAPATPAGTIVNYGTIGGTAGDGVYLGVGGIVTNGAVGSTSALISGVGPGIELVGAPGTLANFAAIIGTGTAGIGVILAAGSTLTNAGSIIGQGGTAVALGGAGDLVVIESGGTFGGALAGFTFGDTIDFAAVGYAPGETAAISGGTLTLSSGLTTLAQLAVAGLADGTPLKVTPDLGGGVDVNLMPPAIPRDFNGDGTSDILWRDSGGNVAVWAMNGLSVAASAIVGFADPSAWTIRGTGDFAGDGKADILWQDAGGNVAVWDMNAFSVVATGIAGFADPSAWSIQATGDFDGDGKSDILWRSTAGNVDIWQMNGTTVASNAIVGFADPTAWSIKGTGDFNGDGRSDILWQDSGGNVDAWEMNGFSVAASAVVGFADPSTWHIRGTGDFNGDGTSDILWQDTSGDVAIWQMNGLSVAASAVVGFADPTSWQIAGTGDYTGDGKTDILWHSTGGNLAVWEMNGFSLVASGIVGFADPSAWHVVPPDNTGVTASG